VFSTKTRYVCRTDIRDKRIQSVQCKTIDVEHDAGRKPATKHADDEHDHIHGSDDSSEEEDADVEFNEQDDDDEEEISSKLVSIKQELKLQSTAAVNVDAGRSCFFALETKQSTNSLHSFHWHCRRCEKSCSTNVAIRSNCVV
jgi:predicted RNA-binding protein Jag